MLACWDSPVRGQFVVRSAAGRGVCVGPGATPRLALGAGGPVQGEKPLLVLGRVVGHYCYCRPVNIYECLSFTELPPILESQRSTGLKCLHALPSRTLAGGVPPRSRPVRGLSAGDVTTVPYYPETSGYAACIVSAVGSMQAGDGANDICRA
jgi:hypothetical protein